MHRQITGCRICGSEWLDVLLELGTQFLTGVFPRSVDESLTKGPLTLVRCDECGLVQLLYSYERTELYGAHYGYRSSLNRKMVSHLEDKARMLLGAVDLRPDDVVVDIGSNDGTLLSFFSGKNLCLLGVDPSAARWRGGYPVDSRLIADFFSADLVRSALGGRKARIVTSIAMFYDLERPLEFVREVADILADDGIWHLEQSYLPAMLRANAYDTVCHEHVEYYAVAQIKWLADKVGLTILDVEEDDVDGGTFGGVTPGTWIPIISEAEARARKPDYFLVFPWHFRAGLVEREAAYLAAGGKLMFPLPSIEVVSTSHR